MFCCNSFKDTTCIEDYIDRTYILLNENGQIIDYNFDTVEEAFQKAKIYDSEKQKYASGKGDSGRKNSLKHWIGKVQNIEVLSMQKQIIF